METIEKQLIDKGYTKYEGNYKSSNWYYGKSFYNDKKEKIYQIIIPFYDFRDYHTLNLKILYDFDCLLIGDERLDLTYSKNVSIDEFEEMSSHFYNSMKKYL